MASSTSTGERLIVKPRDHVKVDVGQFLTGVCLYVPDQVVAVRPGPLVERLYHLVQPALIDCRDVVDTAGAATSGWQRGARRRR